MKLKSGYWYFIEGLSLPKHWKLLFGFKTCNLPAKNVSSSKVTANHRSEECVCVCACVCVRMHLRLCTCMRMCDYRKFMGRSHESILSYHITTLVYQMTFCRASAVQQPMCSLGAQYAFIYFEWTFGLFQMCREEVNAWTPSGKRWGEKKESRERNLRDKGKN